MRPTWLFDAVQREPQGIAGVEGGEKLTFLVRGHLRRKCEIGPKPHGDAADNFLDRAAGASLLGLIKKVVDR